MSGLGPSPTWTVAKLAIWVVNWPYLSTWVWLDRKLPSRPNWVGYKQVALQVHLQIHIRLLYLQFVNSILSKSRFQQPIMRSCMLCSLQYRLIWYLYFTFDIWYLCLSRRSMIELCARRSARCLDQEIYPNYNSWRSVDAHLQDAAGSMSLLFCQ